MNTYFSLNDTIYDIVTRHPKAKDFLISNGFEPLKNPLAFKTMAKKVSLKTALSLQKKNPKLFEERLLTFLEGEYNTIDTDLSKKKEARGDIHIEGVLPCPIRLPLMENFTTWLEQKQKEVNYTISYNLKSANLGLDDLIEKVKSKNPDLLPDLLISAGYELFFDKELMGQYLKDDLFKAPKTNFNSDFANEKIDLRDPLNKYLIIGVVPAVFIVNKKALGNRSIPKTWDDLLSEDFSDSVAIPMGDLDMFNALIISLYARYGLCGIKRLARSYKKSLHPAQMVKNKGSAPSLPAVSITPYFFSQMVNSDDQAVIWPQDGAIISPIFMMSKSSQKERVTPLVDYFISKEVGEIFSSNGKFPSTNPHVDNHLDKDYKFQWIGWDFIHNTDIGALLKELESLFNEEIGLSKS
ncbi:MAG TPA: ABC transporter substrate-binding protein [Lachnospiraceae bacterium]